MVGDGDDVDALGCERVRERVDVDRCSAGPAQREGGVEQDTHLGAVGQGHVCWGRPGSRLGARPGSRSAGSPGEEGVVAAVDLRRVEAGVLEHEGEGPGGEEAEVVAARVEVTVEGRPAEGESEAEAERVVGRRDEEQAGRGRRRRTSSRRAAGSRTCSISSPAQTTSKEAAGKLEAAARRMLGRLAVGEDELESGWRARARRIARRPRRRRPAGCRRRRAPR